MTRRQTEIKAAKAALEAKYGEVSPAKLKGRAWHLYKFKSKKQLERMIDGL